MTTVVKIKKGLDINLKGKAALRLTDGGKSETYAVVPDHYPGITPKVSVREGDRVKAGSVVMTDKYFPEIRFVSPVSGEVAAVNRGEKRKLLSIVIRPDDETAYESQHIKPLAACSGEDIKTLLLQSGLWPFVRQRPYDIVARPDATPRDIFVTACHSAPLAPDFDFIAGDEADAFQVGLDALAKLTPGKVYVGVKKGASVRPQDVELVELDGPHPVGNVGVMINRLCPVNKGEIVWTLNGADVLYIGRLFLKGVVDFTRKVALTGSEMSECSYVKVVAGCTVDSLVGHRTPDAHVRLISGNVLTGVKVSRSDYLCAYDNQITAIPEGDDVHEFLGWATPGFGKYSVSRSYLTWLANRAKEYVLDARVRGGKRAMIMSNEYDRVFPMDIYPEYLLKAIVAFDIDKMENLGIYEVAPEDFALC